MNPAVGGDDVADLVDAERVRRIFKGLLHLTLRSTILVSPGDIEKHIGKVSGRTCLKKPRSPPLECELQSLWRVASWANLSAEPLISSRWPCKISMASSLERAIFGCGNVDLEEGRAA